MAPETCACHSELQPWTALTAKGSSMYKVQLKGHIDKPVEEVFEAVVDPAVLSRYFTTAGARGRLEAGATVSWDFHDFPGEFPVYVLESTAPERVVMQWDAPQGTVEPDEQG